jgi:hypothetical protein
MQALLLILILFTMFHDDHVNISLNASVGQLKQTMEESDQFYKANNEMVISLQAEVIHISDFLFSHLILLSFMRLILRFVFNILTSSIFCFLHQLRRMNL